jgi:hypothetical protein
MLVICHFCHRAVEIETPEEDGFKCPYCESVHPPESDGLRSAEWDEDETEMGEFSDLQEEFTPVFSGSTSGDVDSEPSAARPPAGAAVSAGYQERMRAAVAGGEFAAVNPADVDRPSIPQAEQPEQEPVDPVLAETASSDDTEPATLLQDQDTSPEPLLEEGNSPGLEIEIDLATAVSHPAVAAVDSRAPQPDSDQPATPAGRQDAQRTHLLPTGDWGRLLLFCLGLALGATAVMDWAGRIQERQDQEAAGLRQTIRRHAADALLRADQERILNQQMRATLHVTGSTRPIDLGTGQHRGTRGFSGISQNLVVTASGAMWRLWSGSLRNGSKGRLEAVEVTVHWSRVGDRDVAGVAPFGELAGLTMGRCAEAAACTTRLPAITVRELLDGGASDPEALYRARAVAPGVILSIDPGVTQPFMFFEPAQSLELVPDSWIRVSFKPVQPPRKAVRRAPLGGRQ